MKGKIAECVVHSRILNDARKVTTKRTANYFFVVTIAVALINVLVFAAFGFDTGDIIVLPDWGRFSVNNLLQTVINTFTHFNWQHTLLNMLCFLIAGMYLERKKGSLPFLFFYGAGGIFYGVCKQCKRYFSPLARFFGRKFMFLCCCRAANGIRSMLCWERLYCV